MDLALFPQVTKSQILFLASFFNIFMDILISLLIAQPVSDEDLFDEDLFEARESCISKKTHFHFYLLFDYLWNEHRWERCKFWEKNKHESLFIYKIYKYCFLLLFLWFAICCVCVCVRCNMKTINNGNTLLLVTHIARNKHRKIKCWEVD